MNGGQQPFWIEQPSGRLFAVWHGGGGAAHALVLLCPPLLHEAMRSQRLFALLADALARCGCDVLRFDYSGTGDSDGRDEDFDLDLAKRDAHAALAALQRRRPGIPVHVIGVRAGAFAAVPLARRAGVASLWLWQPVVRGGDHLAHLRRLDAFERANPQRYRQAVGAWREGGVEAVMGFPCSPAFVDTLSAARLNPADVAGIDLGVFEAEGTPTPFTAARRLDLPVALTAWVDRIDMARTSTAPVEALARAWADARSGQR